MMRPFFGLVVAVEEGVVAAAIAVVETMLLVGAAEGVGVILQVTHRGLSSRPLLVVLIFMGVPFVLVSIWLIVVYQSICVIPVCPIF
jgi:hypothetical protein